MAVVEVHAKWSHVYLTWYWGTLLRCGGNELWLHRWLGPKSEPF